MRKRYLLWVVGGMFLFLLVGGGRSASAQEAPAEAEKPAPWTPMEAVGLDRADVADDPHRVHRRGVFGEARHLGVLPVDPEADSLGDF